ncbi:MAG TPA: VanZ family protein [Terriglobia bacterium]|nr:VanZ family protein [Terriglobia bacterium]
MEWSLLTYCFSLMLMITLAPFRFRWPSSVDCMWEGPWFDIVTNVLLFLPLGFLFWLTRKPPKGSGAMHVFLLGFFVSTSIEITQLFLPGRYASVSDVLANAVGAWLGARLCDQAQHRLNRQWIGRLGLELPLMNIVYLLIPLIWLDGLAAGDDRSRSFLAWILGLCGSVVIAGVYRYGIKERRILKLWGLGVVAVCWFLASSLPAFIVSASIPLYGSGLVGVAVCGLVVLPIFKSSAQRRFEIPVLKRVWPLYAAYLLMLLLWPIPSHFTDWRGAWGFAELKDDPSIISMLRLIEDFAAFTLLGYMVAESHGRREISQTTSIIWSCSWCGLAAGLLQLGRGFHPGHVASFGASLLMFTGSAFGASIYWRQLVSIQRILSRAQHETPGATTPLDAMPAAYQVHQESVSR